MSAYSKNEKIVSLDARVPYAPPALTIAGKVEQLTAIGFRGPRDLLHFRNLL